MSETTQPTPPPTQPAPPPEVPDTSPPEEADEDEGERYDGGDIPRADPDTVESDENS